MRLANAFTLIELLITLLIMSILLAVGLPSFSSFVEAKKSNITITRVKQAVEIAKVSAIVNGRIVTLCKSLDGEKCGGAWEDGIIAFTDSNADRTINQDDKLIRYFTFPEAEGSIHWRAFQNRQYLQITSQGFTRFQNGNFTYCPFNKKNYLARQLVINRTARTRYAMDSNGDGFYEDSSGKIIHC
jgi:type IV fimbrial biogenesis protein FimT